MPKTRATADQILTEAVACPRQSEGKVRCPICRESPCQYQCRGDRYCRCVYHTFTRAQNFWAEYGPDAVDTYDILYARHTQAYEHDVELERHRMRRAERERHDQNKANASSELGPREFTLTFSIGNHYPDDETAKAAMVSAIEKLTRYYKDEIIEFHGIGEYTAAGRPHVHGWYHLRGGRKITDKNFKRAYPPWNPKRKLGRGFEGGHHQTIQRVSDFAGYSEKHLEEAWLVVNITNADDSARTSPAQRVLEGVDSTVGEEPLEEHPCGEVPSPSCPQGGGDDC